MDGRGKPVTISVRRTVTVESLIRVNSKDGCGVTADTFRLLASVAHCGRMLLCLKQCGGQNRYSYTMDRHMYIYIGPCLHAVLFVSHLTYDQSAGPATSTASAWTGVGGGGGVGAGGGRCHNPTVSMNHIVLLFKREDGEPNGIEPRSSCFAARNFAF